LTIAHQYIEQLGDVVRSAVFGNVGTIITFRVGAADAEFLVKEFTPKFTEEDLVNIPKYNIYLRLMIDGVASDPFSAGTLPPITIETGNESKVIKVSRERYSKSRGVVEDKIARWSGVETEEMLLRMEQDILQKKMKINLEKKHDFLKAMNGDLQKDEEEVTEVTITTDKYEDTLEKNTKQPETKPRVYKKTDEKNDDNEEYIEIVNCDVCGAKTKVNFKPDPKRPVLCKECLKDYRRQQAVGENAQKFNEKLKSALKSKQVTKPTQTLSKTNNSNLSLSDLKDKTPTRFGNNK